MAVIGTFGSYSAAILGIHNAQTSMHVTGNNIGNINTAGYTRQRADQTSMYDVGTARYQSAYSINIGYGAIVENVSQLRDPYLDIRFRNENSSLGYYEAMQNGLNQLSHILDEVGKGEDDFGMIEAKLGDFKNALRELEQYPDSTQHDDLVNAAASTLCRLFNSAAKELSAVYTNERNKLMESTNEVNKILYNIRDLNEQIRTQSVYGGNALELRDARNLQIDELSKYMKISVTYSMEYLEGGKEVEKLSISLDGTKDPNTGKEIMLVDGIYAAQFQMPETTPQLNTKYDAANTAGMPYATFPDGTPTANINHAYVKNLPHYQNKALASAPYLDSNNNPTWAASETKDGQPTSNAVNAAYYRFMADGPADAAKGVVAAVAVDENGNRTDVFVTNNRNAAKVQPNPNYDPNDITGYKYIADPAKYSGQNPPDGEVLKVAGADGKDYYYTNNADCAAQLDNFNADSTDNLYLYTLDALRRKDGRIRDAGTDDESLPVDLGDNDLYGALQAMRELLTEEGEFSSEEDILRDPDATNKRGIRFYQDMLDSFAQKFAETFNKWNQIPGTKMDVVYESAAGQFVTADKKQIFVAKEPGADAVTPLTPDMVRDLYTKIQDPAEAKDDNGKLIYDGYPQDDEAYTKYQEDVQLYQSYMDALRSQGVLTEKYDYYDGGVLFSNNGNNNDPTGITAANISVANAWSEGSVRVLNTMEENTFSLDANGNPVKQDGKTRNDNIAHMMSFMDQKMGYVTTDTVRDAVSTKKDYFSGTFQEMWGRAPALLGDDSQTVNLLTYNYSTTTLSLDNDRISVSGVDLNEEATDMMKFSQAFSAACQLLTTIDSMLDKLINNTLR